jgi:hypothetical protein
MEYDTLFFYRSGLLAKQWRWRYIASGNSAKLANGGEAYRDLGVCTSSAFRVCGLENPLGEGDFGHVDTLVERDNGYDLMIRFRA